MVDYEKMVRTIKSDPHWLDLFTVLSVILLLSGVWVLYNYSDNITSIISGLVAICMSLIVMISLVIIQRLRFIMMMLNDLHIDITIFKSQQNK